MNYKWQKKWILEEKKTLNWAFVLIRNRKHVRVEGLLEQVVEPSTNSLLL